MVPGAQLWTELRFTCRDIIVLVSVVTFWTFLPAVTELRSYAGSYLVFALFALVSYVT